MPIDHSFALEANPATFIGANKIGLSEVAVNLGLVGLQVINNMVCRVTLSQGNPNGFSSASQRLGSHKRPYAKCGPPRAGYVPAWPPWSTLAPRRTRS